MESWWSLGEGSGQYGHDLALYEITCPFCMEAGNFKTAFHAEKKKPSGSKKLNFDTLECGNCKGYVMVLWSASTMGGSHGIHAYRVLPWPLKLERYPKHWPETIGRYWLQAKRNLRDENWDAAALMARSALQVALRAKEAQGGGLKREIDDLAAKGILPPIMKDWSDNVRELGNESAHPKPEQEATDPQDARDVVRFLDFLLEYLYDLPHQIEEYQGRTQEE
ncbi:MAG: DUF4145 domain-containing protein [Verrucomicrobia bacterium]|nr:DUF4145 domain-containing protein [Verrucomicrobiota bacterium]